METKGLFQFKIINVLVGSFALFEYLCYGTTAIINMFIAEINVRRQNMTSKGQFYIMSLSQMFLTNLKKGCIDGC